MIPTNSPSATPPDPLPLGLRLRLFLHDWPELTWGLAALAMWWALGFALAPFTATYGPEFLHKAVVTLARMTIAISFTELAVLICFPSVRKWVRDGNFRSCFSATGLGESSLAKLKIATAVHLVIFAAVLVSLSL